MNSMTSDPQRFLNNLKADREALVANYARQLDKLNMLINAIEDYLAASPAKKDKSIVSIASSQGKEGRYFQVVDVLKTHGLAMTNEQIRQALADKGIDVGKSSMSVLLSRGKDRPDSEIEKASNTTWCYKPLNESKIIESRNIPNDIFG